MKLTFSVFLFLMLALGASDSLRGIFAAVFSSHFALSAAQVGLIVTVSYIGNLVFLMIGGNLIERFDKKKAIIALTCVWIAALCCFAFTDSYIIILIGMFVAMGASTLINTTLSLVTPLLFSASPAFFVNVIYFFHGVGVTSSQSVIGSYATSFSFWQAVNIGLIIVGAIVVVALVFVKIPSTDNRSRPVHREKSALKNKAAIPLILVFGCYFVLEHGIMNWLVAYATTRLKMSQANAANLLAMFFGGIMVGRILLSPLVDKLGIIKSMGFFSSVAAILYVLGIIGGSETLWLLAASGLFLSILYPTLVMSIRLYYPPRSVAGAAGTIISIASLFDILFNVAFGQMVDTFGYSISIYILPVSMIAFVAVYFGLLCRCKTIEKK